MKSTTIKSTANSLKNVSISFVTLLKNINYALFALLNATPASPQWAIEMAIFIAKDLILIVPLLVVTLWLWGPAQRQMVFKLMLALTISLTVSWAIGHLYPHDRPFVAGVGYNFLHHAADDSFPSDHGTVSFTFALAFLFWHRLWSGALLMAIAAAIAWSRVYLGVHWPLDMVGGLLAGMCGCLGAALIWHTFGPALYHQLQRLYRLCFSLPIRKGWVRG